MKQLAAEFKTLLEDYLPSLRGIQEEEMRFKPEPSRWSKREIMGHLIDSAHTNIRRFVASQYEDKPFLVYNQNEWVRINRYQEWKDEDVIDLWYALNKQVCNLMENITEENAQRIAVTDTEHTIEWLMVDYITHLKHHIHQVLVREPLAYP